MSLKKIIDVTSLVSIWMCSQQDNIKSQWEETNWCFMGLQCINRLHWDWRWMFNLNFNLNRIVYQCGNRHTALCSKQQIWGKTWLLPSLLMLICTELFMYVASWHANEQMIICTKHKDALAHSSSDRSCNMNGCAWLFPWLSRLWQDECSMLLVWTPPIMTWQSSQCKFIWRPN